MKTEQEADRPTVDFGKEYPKLYQSGTLLFTTLRKDNRENYRRFNGKQGKIFDVTVRGQFKWTAKLLLVTRINAADLSAPFLAYDTDDDGEAMRDISMSGSDYFLLIFTRWLPTEKKVMGQ